MRAGLGPCAILLLLATAPPVLAQVNLPPPPPPPIDTSSGAGTSTATPPPSATHKPKPQHKPEPAQRPAPPPQPPPQPPPREPRPEPPPRAVEPESPRTMSIRLNPLPFFLSRLSADFEFMLAPHHALVVSPNITFHKFAFHRSDVVSYGMGYADDNSSGFGTEVGYHYWLRRQVEGIYVGPSLLFGGTTPPIGKTFAYYGAAFDVGYQYFFPSGFTLNGGGGVMVTGAAGTTAHAAPRFLFGVGWSF